MLGTELSFARRMWGLLVEDFDSSVTYVYSTLQARNQSRPMWSLFPRRLFAIVRDFWLIISCPDPAPKTLFVRRYVVYILFFSMLGLSMALVVPFPPGFDYALAYFLVCLSLFLLSDYAHGSEGAATRLVILNMSFAPLIVFEPRWVLYVLPIVIMTMAYAYSRMRAPTRR